MEKELQIRRGCRRFIHVEKGTMTERGRVRRNPRGALYNNHQHC